MRGLLLSLLLIHASVSAATYFVTPSGAGTRTGTTWQNAGNGIAWVNSKTKGGDTVYFGAGEYYNGPIIPPVNYNSNDRTCYADSSLWAGNTSIIGGKARIWGGYNVKDSAWSVHSGAIYKTTKWNPSSCISGGTNTVVLVVDDSIYTSKTSLSGVTGPGQFTYVEGSDMLYVWFWGNATPSSRTRIVPSCRTCVLFTSDDADYTTFWGLQMFASAASSVHAKGGVDQDSMFIDHCVMKFIGNTADGNTGGYYGQNIIDADGSPCNGNLDCPYTYHRKWNRMRACSTMYIKWEGTTGYRGTHITLYSESHFTAESSYFAWGGGVQFKQHGPINMIGGGHSYGNVLKYSEIENCDVGVVLLNYQTQDSIYGNLFHKFRGGEEGCWINIRAGSISGTKGKLFICNNTFYGVGKLIQSVYVNDRGYYNRAPNFLKYNLIVDDNKSEPAGLYAMLYNREDTNWVVDSNVYWNVSSGSVFRITGTSVGLSGWQAQLPRRHDVRSKYNTTNPAFVNVAAGDFSRPTSVQEMNVTYGGRTWTRLGAWQPGGATPPPPPPPPPPPDTVLCTTCTGSMTGNVDGDAADMVDMSDLLMMMDYVLNLAPTSICLKEANVDGSADGMIDMSDLIALIDFLGGRRATLAPCQ